MISSLMSEMYDRWRGNMGVPSGGFYHATDQKQVLSSKKARLGTSHVLQRKIEAQQVIQFPGNIKNKLFNLQDFSE